MRLPRPFKRPHRHRYAQAFTAAFAAVLTCAAALAGSASAQVTSASAATAREQALARSVANVPTLDRRSSDMASLGAIPARMSCAQLAKTTQVNGQKIQIVKYQTASASAGSPVYCAVTGHINTYIGFEMGVAPLE